MHEYLASHSKIFMAVKEIHYFGRDLDFHPRLETEADYLNHFAGAADQAYLGDASVSYLYSRLAAAEIRAFSPDARIIAMLRNPADLIHSKHAQELFQGTESEKNFARALNNDLRHKQTVAGGGRLPTGPVYRNYCFFTEQLRRFVDCFGPNRVHVIIYDDFKEDTEREFLQTLAFLELTPETLPEFRLVNPRSGVRSYHLRNFLNNPVAPLKQRARFLPRPIRGKILQVLRFLNSKKEKGLLNPRIRKSLGKEFREEVDRLGDFLKRDLSCWNRQNGL